MAKNRAAVQLGRKGGKASAGVPKCYSAEELVRREERLIAYRESQRIKAIEATVWIYGFYNSANEAEYVGRTIHPARRESWHRGTERRRTRVMDGIKGCEFRIIRATDHQNAGRIEAQVIAAYRKKGQCALNVCAGHSGSYTGRGVRIASSDGRVFGSVQVAALAYDCSASTIYNALNHHGGEILVGPTQERVILTEVSKPIEEIEQQKGKT